MALTKIDCQIVRDATGSSGESSLYAVLNPRKKPGSLVAVGTIAARDNIGGQVACKLALEHFVTSILGVDAGESASPEQSQMAIQEREDLCVASIEGAFRSANTSVYEFGHKLAAGGRMAASLVGFFIQDRVVAVGRAGTVSAYLIRRSEVCPFFPGEVALQRETGFIGENSVVTVELSSIELREHDRVIALPTLLSQEQQQLLCELTFRQGRIGEYSLEAIVRALYPAGVQLPFVLEACIGPEVIYLAQSARASTSQPTAKGADL